jgi:two-component system chemotaxis response regulator CheY
VLVIDDDEIVLQAIRDLLVAAGYEVHTLVSPIGATQVIMSKQIQAVVVDLNMPVMRGDRFISLLRSWDKIRDLPTVLISGASSLTLEEAVKQLPGVSMVTKDTMQRTLPETLRRMLGRERGSLARPSMGTPRK